MASTFANGDTVFLSDGQEVEYIAGSAGEHVVRPVFDAEDDFDEPRYGRPFTVYEVFAEAPVAKYDERIAKLRVEVDELEARAKAAREASRTFEQEERERRARIQLHGQLETLDNLLTGKITHVVTRSSMQVGVTTIRNAVKGEREYSDLVGLSLKASRDGENVRWTVGDSSRWVILCTSQEQAYDIAAKAIEQEFEGHRRSGGYSEELLRLYATIGRTPPADLLERARQSKLAHLKTFADKAERELASYRQQIDTLALATPSDTHEVG